MLKFSDFFSLDSLHGSEWMPETVLDLTGPALKAWMSELLKRVGSSSDLKSRFPGAFFYGDVHVASGVEIEPTAMIHGPAYIASNAVIRHGAYIRGYVFVGDSAVVGHCTEIKESVLLDGAKAAHFAYLGNSVLGQNVNLGAGTRVANLRFDKKPVKVTLPFSGERYQTGLKKLGAILGDNSQTGCNSVLSPGSILTPGSSIMPCQHFVGTK